MALPGQQYVSFGDRYSAERKSNARRSPLIRGALSRLWIFCIVLVGIPLQLMFVCFYLMHLMMFAICMRHQRTQNRRQQRLRSQAWRRALDCMHPAKTYCSFSDGTDTVCIICLDEIKADDLCRKLLCDHLYHDNCIFEWCQRRPQCPLCNQALQLEVDYEPVKI
eukprot:Plantae.Rhodophyta-Purpureofilum_apyrenoidigerum.ctg14955.p1 GENE.Plantae.Rhodophyta-Purpureofilum_apyrenoidigerum.ctg14955~~Plantae.Rhodophyta-Purpureofilum_apyrenoidigerum.ctg14955.p1  ORF type:complete len:165 (+),score=12.12 Plantae.Rhodophyta-Purpureofilum_apyrenoidigerum.ctg14955:244-738(+)